MGDARSQSLKGGVECNAQIGGRQGDLGCSVDCMIDELCQEMGLLLRPLIKMFVFRRQHHIPTPI